MASSADHPHQSTLPVKNPITGIWYNKLGSMLEMTATGDGSLVGKYCSSVGDVEGLYALTGRFDTVTPPGKGVSLGWTVTWRNELHHAESTTTWSGQYFAGHAPLILTQWLLTRSTPPNEVWSSTHVGHDEFSRVKPTSEAILLARARNEGSDFPPVYKD